MREFVCKGSKIHNFYCDVVIYMPIDHVLVTSSDYLALIGAGIAHWYSAELRDEPLAIRGPAGVGIFLFTSASRQALGPTQPPIQ